METLFDIYNLIEQTALSYSNIHSVVPEFTDLNREDAKYSAFVIQQREHTKTESIGTESPTFTYNFYLGYVDRLTEDKSNRLEIQSVGIDAINTIVDRIKASLDRNDIVNVGQFIVFTQRFTAECAGVYASVEIDTSIPDCGIGGSEIIKTQDVKNVYIPAGEVLTTVLPDKGYSNMKEVIVKTDPVGIDLSTGINFAYSTFTECPYKLVVSNKTEELSVTYLFYRCNNLVTAPMFDTSNVTDMNSVFEGLSQLTSVPLYDTSKVTKMSSMFSQCSQLTIIPQFDTSKVTTMYRMFYDCSSLTSVPLFDTSNVIDMRNMFYNCNSLASVPLFDTSNVTDMNSMFYFCSSLTSVPQFDTSNVTDMNSMFCRCNILTSVPQFDTSKVTTMYNMFYDCSKLTSVPQFNTSKVTNMRNMFRYCSSLTSVPQFDTSKVTSVSDIVYDCTSLTDLGGFTGLKVNLSLSSSTLLTHDSIMNVINEAADVTASPKTLTLGSTNLAKLSDEEKAIAAAKGWTLK